MRFRTPYLSILAGLIPFAAAAAQSPESAPQSQPASIPTSQPQSLTTQPVNPLRSQASMIEYFYDSIDRGEDGQADALRCLNASNVDSEKWNAEQRDYLAKLIDILKRLEAEKLFDRAALSDDPAAPPGTIGKDPLLLVLQRTQIESADSSAPARFIWQFSAPTVADLPTMHEKLDELIADATTPAEVVSPADASPKTPNAVDPLRSPYHMVQFFVLKVQEAENDPAAYSEAMKCLDFSQVDEAKIASDGPTYVDDLRGILAYLREKGRFDREKLAQDSPAEAHVGPFTDDDESTGIQVLIVRQGQQWRFASQTVAKVPEWIEKLAAGAQVIERRTVPLDNSSPGATLNLFFTAMARNDLPTAVSCLDLSELQDTDPSVTYPIAGKIKLVLDREKMFDPERIDESLVEGATRAELVKYVAGRIEIVKTTSADGEVRWLFSKATVRQIDRLYRTRESEPILPDLRGQRLSFWALPSLYTQEYVIPPSLKPRWAGLQYWQWLGIVLVVLLGVLMRQICSFVLPPVLRRMLSTSTAAIMPITVRRGARPTFYLVMIAVWWGGLRVLDLGTRTTAWTSWSLRILFALVAVVAFYKLIDLLTAYFSARAAKTASRMDDVLVPLLQKTSKVVVIAIGGIVVAKAFGFEVGPLLAGLGVGGLAFGLAAQDTLKNFFGSVNVVLDRPFQVGDWVKIGNAEGTVEQVGLRSSRIRTFYNSQITVPNSDLITATIDNMGRRRYRRINTMLGVLYSTPPESLDAFCEGIRELIRLHPYTRKDYYHVYVNEFAASSINILLYCFHECPEWGTELRERHRLFLDIMRLAQKLGVEFAFPTQTMHLHHESSPDTPPPKGSEIPSEPTHAESHGRDVAKGIVTELLGEDPESNKPAPVKY